MTDRADPTVSLLLAAIIMIVASSGVGVLGRRTATSISEQVTASSLPATNLDTLAAPAGPQQPPAVGLPPGPDPVLRPSPAASPDTPQRTASPPVAAGRASGPLRIRAPRIAVDAPVIDLGLNRDGTLEVPSGARDAGWWTGGAMPGQIGSSVIVGHVDLHGGPAVFFRLHELARGDEVLVDLADGTTLRYIARWSASYPKDRFPTNLVYGHTAAPTLRLVTCGGAFDRATRHYVDNLVVFLDYDGVVDA